MTKGWQYLLQSCGETKIVFDSRGLSMMDDGYMRSRRNKNVRATGTWEDLVLARVQRGGGLIGQ